MDSLNRPVSSFYKVNEEKIEQCNHGRIKRIKRVGEREQKRKDKGGEGSKKEKTIEKIIGYKRVGGGGS